MDLPDIHIHLADGRTIGPYTVTETRQRVFREEISLDTIAHRAGAEDTPLPLREILGLPGIKIPLNLAAPSAPRPAPAPAPAPSSSGSGRFPGLGTPVAREITVTVEPDFHRPAPRRGGGGGIVPFLLLAVAAGLLAWWGLQPIQPPPPPTASSLRASARLARLDEEIQQREKRLGQLRADLDRERALPKESRFVWTAENIARIKRSIIAAEKNLEALRAERAAAAGSN